MEAPTEQFIEKRILFPNDLLGRFIGTGGKNIKILQGRHLDVSIRVDKKNVEGDYTPIIVRGKNKSDVEAAREEIKQDRTRWVAEQQAINGPKICQYGSECKRKKCTFLHPNYNENWNRASGTEKRRNKNKSSKDE